MATCDLDPLHKYLGPRGRFQIWQMMLVSIGGICAQYQLFDNIFIGMDVPYRCASPPVNHTTPTSATPDVIINSSHALRYEQCKIVVTDNVTDDIGEQSYGCLYGYYYEWDKRASFVSEMDLVCDSYLLVSLVQTFVVLGQAVGAFVASIISDRFGRKGVLIGSQFGLLLVGVAIGTSPSYPVLVFFKFLVGTFQQGVVTTIATIGIELFPRQQRSLCALIINLWWALGSCSMALIAYVLRNQSWRVLQYVLSSVSLLPALLQLFWVEESMCWLAANGKLDPLLHVLKRASHANSKDPHQAQLILRQCLKWQMQETEPATATNTDSNHIIDAGSKKTNALVEEDSLLTTAQLATGQSMELNLTSARKLTHLDMFRHKLLRFNALLTFFAWFTVAFVVFTLYLMSTSFAGNPYINYFFTALMEVPPAILLYFGVDRLGRKHTVQAFFTLAGLSCIASAICRIFTGSATLGTMAAVFAMIGMVGGSGAFGGLFFYTPEYFPTNFRNQALGMGSTVGRIGGMIAPFMKNLAVVAVWSPGVITGSLCLLVVISVKFLPETRGKVLPADVEDIEAWYWRPEKQGGKGKPAPSLGNKVDTQEPL